MGTQTPTGQPGGTRLAYDGAPAAIRRWVGRELGSDVTAAVDCAGGFSPGPAARVVTATGRRAFVKAVGAELNPDSPGLLRSEIAALSAIPPHPCVPRVYATYDDGDWVALLLEEVRGDLPVRPWTLDAVDRVADAFESLQEVLDPCPWDDAPLASDRARPFFEQWRAILADPPPDLGPWWRAHLERVAEHASRALGAVDGPRLAHWDVRSDNVIIGDGRVVLVDWGQSRRAKGWVDPLLLLIDIASDGSALDPEVLRRRLPMLRDADGEQVVDVVCALALAFRHSSRMPPIPGIPTLRGWQRHWADSLTGWLGRLL